MKLRFTKMQGLGNDFVVFDGVRQHQSLNPNRTDYARATSQIVSTAVHSLPAFIPDLRQTQCIAHHFEWPVRTDRNLSNPLPMA